MDREVYVVKAYQLRIFIVNLSLQPTDSTVLMYECIVKLALVGKLSWFSLKL